jgi:hypothetical protein
MSGEGEPFADSVAAAAARTAAAGTARLFSAWAADPSAPEIGDRRCEGVADFGARRARVSEVLFSEDRAAELFPDRNDDDQAHRELSQPHEMIYAGADAFIRVSGRWTGFFLGDLSGPRGPNDPLWPLDALWGARRDAVEIGSEAVRGVPTTRCRLTVDLARADALVPAGVSVPAGPYRALLRMPAEVWLDEAGLARRVAVSPEPEGAAGAGERTWATVELWDFGVAVDITPPRPDEVAPPREAFGGTPEPGA